MPDIKYPHYALRARLGERTVYVVSIEDEWFGSVTFDPARAGRFYARPTDYRLLVRIEGQDFDLFFKPVLRILAEMVPSRLTPAQRAD